MRHTATVALALAFVAVSAPGRHALLAQERVSGTSSVVGRVLNASTGVPVRQAAVVAVRNVEDDPTGGGAFTAITDDEGRYQLDRLAAGNWQVTASKGGYVTWQFGQRRPFEVPPPLTLTRGQRLTADIPLTRSSAIAGRVHDEFGEPLAGLQVRAYRARMEQGYRRLEAVGAADRTDDTGAFRVYGLPPGAYYVAASLRVAPADSPVETTYAPTYFPGTGDLAEAQRITLELGDEGGATFPLLPVRRVRVSGVVLNSSGAPADAFLSLDSEAAELGVPFGVAGVTRSDGTFTLPDVPPGRYRLSASLRGDGRDESAFVPVTIDADDVTGTTLLTGRPATLRGSFVADAGISRRLPGRLKVTAVAARARGTVLSGDSGATFELDSLNEPFFLSVDGLPDDWAVKEILVNGVSALDDPVDLERGQWAEARIVLTDRPTEVSGVVEASPSAGTVVVFPEDQTKLGPRGRYVRRAEADADGRFRIRGLPPGERYLAFAASYLEDEEHTDPEFLERMRDLAVPFSVGEGERSTITLRVVER